MQSRLVALAGLGAAVIVVVAAPGARAEVDPAEAAASAREALYSAKMAIFEERQKPLLKDVAQPTDDDLIRTAEAALKQFREADRQRLALLALSLRGLEIPRAHLERWLAEVHPEWQPEDVAAAIDSLPELHTGDADARVEDSIATLQVLKGAKPTDTEVALDTGLSTEDVAAWRVREKERAELEKKQKEQSAFSQLSKRGFGLQRSLKGADAGKPALFSVVASKGKSAVFSTDVALTWSNEKSETGDFLLSAGIEAHVSSDDSESQNSILVQPGLIHLTDHTWTSLGLKYETDRDFDTHKGTLEVMFTPNGEWVEPYAIGAPTGSWESPLQFRWRPEIGLEGGYTFRTGDSKEEEDGILRVVGRLRADLFLNTVRDFLQTESVSLYAEDTLRILPIEDDREVNNLLMGGLNVSFDQHLSVDVNYKYGRAPPLFESISTFGASLGIKF